MAKRYIARQPIMDTSKHIYGYELLYRNSDDNFFPEGISSTVATQQLISSIQNDFDVMEISGNNISFINFPSEVIMSEFILCINPTNIIIEILEDVVVDVEFTERVKKLKELGYTFAIDDFTGEQNIKDIISYISIIKVDYLLTSVQKQQEIIKEYESNVILLAEKIETQKDYDLAVSLGYQLFQGYFFSKPTLIVNETLDVLKSSTMSLWNELAAVNLDYDKIATVVKGDAGMTYRLLNTINTMKFLPAIRITSAKEAFVRMGTINVKKWLTLILVQNVADEKEEETINIALIRAYLVEEIAKKIPYINSKELYYYAYLRGMFSVFSEEKQKEIIAILNLEINEKDNAIIMYVVSIVFAYENGEWEKVIKLASKYGISMEDIYESYKAAITCTNELNTDTNKS